MRRFRNEFSLLIFVVALWHPVLAAAQQEGSAEQAPARDTPFVLTLNKVVGLPGQEASLPVLFARKSGAPNVAKLRFRLSYPGSVIEFRRIEDAYLSRRVSLQIEAKEENPGGKDRTLEVNFSLPDPQGKEFPSGQIATIFFAVAAGAPDQVVHLNPQAWIDGAEILPDSPTAQVEPGEVRVSQTPVFVGCFFFTH